MKTMHNVDTKKYTRITPQVFEGVEDFYPDYAGAVNRLVNRDKRFRNRSYFGEAHTDLERAAIDGHTFRVEVVRAVAGMTEHTGFFIYCKIACPSQSKWNT